MFVHTHSSLALPDISVSPRMSVCVSHNMYIYIYMCVCVCCVCMCVNANCPIYDFGRIVVIVHTNVRQQKLKRQIILTIPNQFELPRITKTLILIMVVTVILSHCPGDHPVSNDICTAKPNTTRQIMKRSIWHRKLLIIFSMDLHVSRFHVHHIRWYYHHCNTLFCYFAAAGNGSCMVTTAFQEGWLVCICGLYLQLMEPRPGGEPTKVKCNYFYPNVITFGQM